MIDGKEWFRAMREIEAAKKKGLLSKEQAKEMVLSCERELRVPNKPKKGR